MFKKKPVIKTLSPLRSSDRRKTADKIIADLRLETTTGETPSGETTEQAQAEATSARSALRKSLLPDNALSAKFTTTSGPDLKEVAGIVYVGSHGNSREQRVLWVKIEEVLYPTVYTLWHNPRIIPLLHTPSLVVEKLKGGADLMTPGLAGPPFPASARKGALVAVASLENPSVPVAVGTCAIDISSLKTTRGAKGHAVETFHWAGDDLWDWSTSGKAGGVAPDELPEWLAGPGEGLAKATEGLGISDEEGDQGGVALSTQNEKSSPDPAYNKHVSGEDVANGTADGGEGFEMSTQEIDDAFRQAFLYGVYEQRRSHPREPKFGLNFPLHQSLFMSHLVFPYLPAYSAEKAHSLQIKKTSWKNARKYIKALDKDKLLLSKEQKNEASVLDIDFEDSHFTGFQPYRLPKKDSNDTRGGEASGSTEDSHDDSIGQKLKVLTLYRPKDSLAPLFRASNAPKLTWYDSSDIRSAVTAYIESANLIKAGNKRTVNLDPILSNAVLSEETSIDRELLAKGTIPRDVLIERVVSLCAPFHSILRNGETLEASQSKPRAGLPPKVGILLETRGGNKTVTRVYGLDPFHVPAQPLADELRKVCASSTSVEPFKGGKGLEMMIQGPQKDAVIKALDRRGVSKGWIEVNDKTKGKKK